MILNKMQFPVVYNKCPGCICIVVTVYGEEYLTISLRKAPWLLVNGKLTCHTYDRNVPM